MAKPLLEVAAKLYLLVLLYYGQHNSQHHIGIIGISQEGIMSGDDRRGYSSVSSGVLGILVNPSISLSYDEGENDVSGHRPHVHTRV